MKFSERLRQLKGSRPVSGWERQAGIARGNLDRAIKDGKLSDENIRKLCRLENARADWILFGTGTPYQIAACHADQELSHQICAHHTDEAARWNLTVIIRHSDNLPRAVVMTMPGQYPVDQHGKASSMVDYTITEVLVGPIGPYSREAIKREGWRKRQQLTLDDVVVESLCNGGIGTYALTLAPGFLKDAVPLDDKTLTELASDVAEFKNGYAVPLTPPEQRLLKTYRAMRTDDRARLLAIADTLNAFSDS
jgi:hypothetical protein